MRISNTVLYSDPYLTLTHRQTEIRDRLCRMNTSFFGIDLNAKLSLGRLERILKRVRMPANKVVAYRITEDGLELGPSERTEELINMLVRRGSQDVSKRAPSLRFRDKGVFLTWNRDTCLFYFEI